MKRIMTFIIATVLVITLLLLLSSNKRVVQVTQPNPLPTVTPQESQKYVAPSGTTDAFKTDWIIIRDLKRVQFFSNLDDKLTSSEIISVHSCNYLVNGGFYTKENNPIGLLIVNGIKVHDAQSNALFNGYFSVNNNKALISSSPPSLAQYAVQAGPLIMLDNNYLPIQGGNSEKDRRVLAAILDDGNAAFLVMYDKKSPLNGPALKEIPGILKELENNSSLSLRSVMNLDGGSASTFISENVKLSEISRVGSYFCISL